MLIKAPLRGEDDFGSGAYHAPRGSRNHRGIDYACHPGSIVYAPVDGVVVKIGYPYAQSTNKKLNAVGYAKFAAKTTYRYVDILSNGKHHRVFYIDPTVAPGDEVMAHTTEIGVAQALSKAYGPRMTPHVHYEVITYEDGHKVDHNPAEFLA